MEVVVVVVLPPPRLLPAIFRLLRRPASTKSIIARIAIRCYRLNLPLPIRRNTGPSMPPLAKSRPRIPASRFD